MKTTLIIVFFSLITTIGYSQTLSYDAKYDITVFTTARNATGELWLKNGNGNTFNGLMIIDGNERDVFGWYIEKRSEGGGYIYNTKGIVFYVKLNADFMHQQLFKGIFNYDETVISGDFFYWGNEFIFNATKTEIVQDSTIVKVQ